MLDAFEIITTSGVVLWSRSYVEIGHSLINDFLRHVFIEERSKLTGRPIYKQDGRTLKWVTAKDLGLIFVAVYESILHISWIDTLLDNIRALFSELYRDQIKKKPTTRIECPFDPYFDRLIAELEKKDAAAPPIVKVSHAHSEREEEGNDSEAAANAGSEYSPTDGEFPSSVKDDSLAPTPDTSRPASPAAHLLAAKNNGRPRGSRRQRKAANAVAAVAQSGNGLAQSSGEESGSQTGSKLAKKKGKAKRRWGADGTFEDVDDDGSQLDFSSRDAAGSENTAALEDVDQSSWGTRTADGAFMLKDIGDEMDAIISASNEKNSEQKPGGVVGSSLGALSGLFRNVVGGKVLTKEDLEKPLKTMEEHLMKKNVAREAALRLCNSIERDLVGIKTNNFTSIEATIRTAMEKALRKMLTPTTPLDLLREITATTKSSTSPRPYVISIVGVNGVGKSTNLSKICYFLLQNGHRVLIAAGDTFRSGAVEQLRVHVRNLRELTARQGVGHVDLYERGYGKDAAIIAADAVKFAKAEKFDVVLIDTAGRRHNDQRLMSSLEKFAKLAQPDKILMVGEALVGTDSVSQARNFDAAFGPGRRLDGFIVSKCDTVGDMVGTLVSMVHATGIPVLFLGTGQHYSDLRTLRAESVVELLMRS